MENRVVWVSMRALMANGAAISGQEASHWSFYIHFGKQPWQSDGERRIIRYPYHLSKRHNTVEKFRTRQLRRLAQKATRLRENSVNDATCSKFSLHNVATLRRNNA